MFYMKLGFKIIIISFDNFYCYSVLKNKNCQRGRPSGGISLFIKSMFRKGIKIYEKHSTDFFVWIRLDKNIFQLDEDLFLCVVYLPPEGSSSYQCLDKDIFDSLEESTVYFDKKGEVLLVGDFNCRTGTLCDYLKDDDHNYLNLPLALCPTSNEVIHNRANIDIKVNWFGKKLIDLCKATDIKILNVRTLGDVTDQCTYFGFHGSSTVDYAICSTSIRNR